MTHPSPASGRGQAAAGGEGEGRPHTRALAAAAAALALLSLAACDPWSSGRPEEGLAAAPAVLAEIGLTLPPSTRIEHVDVMRGIDDAARLSFTLPTTDWPALLRQITAKAGERPVFEGDGLLGSYATEGWRPDRAPSLQIAPLPWAGGMQSLTIAVAPVDAQCVRIFIFWHEI